MKTTLFLCTRCATCVAASALLLLGIGSSLAAEATDAAGMHLSESAFLESLPVVLTASRLSQPQSETPNATTVIDRKMIEASGFRTVPEVLRLVPGMYVGFADANRPVVSLHGSGDEFAHRMQVLVDGRSIYLPPFGSVLWADLPVLFDEIERIEVVRGPSSAAHGSNAFYGTINIITYGPGIREGLHLAARAGAAADLSASYSATEGTLAYTLAFGKRADSGLEEGKLNDYNSTRVYSLRARLRPGFTDEVFLQLGGSKGVYGLGIYGRPEDAFRETSSASDFQQLSWLHLWSDNDESSLTASRTARSHTDPKLCVFSFACEFPYLSSAIGFIRQSDYSQRDEVELQNTHRLNAEHRLVWGGGVRRDYADYSVFLEEPTSVKVWRVFAHDEWRINESAILNLGAMHENDGLGNANTSPRMSLNYHLSPAHTVRLGWSTATRSPVMVEAFIKANNTVLGGRYVRPLQPLTPERIESREIGYLGEFQGSNMSLDLRLYQERLWDQIWWDRYVMVTPDFREKTSPDSFKNLFSTEYLGLEATLKKHWDAGHSFVAASYTFQQATAGLSSAPTQYYSAAPFEGGLTWGQALQRYYQSEYLNLYPETVPKHSLSLLVSQALPNRWHVGGGYYFRTQVRVGDVGADVTPETLMRRLDLRATKSFKLSGGGVAELSMVVQNATQEDYTKYGTVNAVAELQFARRAWLGLKIDL